MHFSSDCHLCVDLVGLLRQLPVYSVKFCTSLRTDARTTDTAAAARGCREVLSTTSQVGFGVKQRCSKTEGRIVPRN